MSEPILRTFKGSRAGGGIFGKWILDNAGLPAYEYRINQFRSKRARYEDSQGRARCDHWHQIGNDHITALAANDGTIQVYLCDRGGVFLNRFEADRHVREPVGEFDLRSWLRDPLNNTVTALLTFVAPVYRAIREQWYRWRLPEIRTAVSQRMDMREVTDPSQADDAAKRNAEAENQKYSGPPKHTYAGGFGYIEDDADTWCTAYAYRPAKAKTRRVFGMGYCETSIEHHNLIVTRHVYAPYGNDPLLLADVTIKNNSPQAVTLNYYEYWDVNVHQLQLQWLCWGVFADLGDNERRAINDDFTPSLEWLAPAQTLRFHQTPTSPQAKPPNQPDFIDWAPGDVFLADLNEKPPATYYTDREAFFGDAPDAVRRPAAIVENHTGGTIHPPSSAMPYCLVVKRVVHLEPREASNGSVITLRFAYGALPHNEPLTVLDRYRLQPNSIGTPTPNTFADTQDRWKSAVSYFTTAKRGDLQREMAWHAYNLLSSTVYSEYHETHLIPQGSAYLYSHGADGAPRDQSLFAIPLTYVCPDLAKQTLTLIMRLTDHASHAIPYSFAGHGMTSDAMHAHACPSDLDLFFLLGLSEYLSATGDLAFLDQPVRYYPRGSEVGTVLDHIRAAFTHLISAVGTDPDSKLIRIGDGDWSDSIVLETAVKHPLTISKPNSIKHGESIPNTQMAVYVLPLIANLIEARDKTLADQMRGYLPQLTTGLKNMWRKDDGWFVRAVLRDHSDEPICWPENGIDLEAQPWALISDLAKNMQVEAKLINTITKRLDKPSPIGTALNPGGMVWPAISQLLTWGYAHSGHPQEAWRSFTRNTFAQHARHFPDVWFNIWSGPDGVFSSNGRTWNSPATPMSDFPVMNANQNAMALLAMLRVCGIEPARLGDGLVIAPQSPPREFELDTALLHLRCDSTGVKGKYRAIVNGERILYVRAPNNRSIIDAQIDGKVVQGIPSTSKEVPLRIAFNEGDSISFEVQWG